MPIIQFQPLQYRKKLFTSTAVTLGYRRTDSQQSPSALSVDFRVVTVTIGRLTLLVSTRLHHFPSHLSVPVSFMC